MSGPRSRVKGLAGEREVAGAFREVGWTVRGLEGEGDWLAFRPAITDSECWPAGSAVTVHVEVKRAETLKLPMWLQQARDEAPEGVPPVLCFRSNRMPWYAALPLDDLLRLIG